MARRSGGAREFGPLRRVLYVLFWISCHLLFRLWFRMRVAGRPRPFPRGPLVVAANHCSFLDPVLLAVALPRRVTYLVTSSVYYQPFFRPWMWIFGCIPVNDGSVNVEAMRRAVAALARGEVVGIFPEGGISDDGRLQEGEIGVSTLLRQGGAPVLTVGLVGTHEALPRGGGFPKPKQVEVLFSDLIDPAAASIGRTPQAARRALRDLVMAGIARVLPDRMKPPPSG